MLLTFYHIYPSNMKETGTIPVCLYLLLYGISLKAPPALAFLSCLPSYFHPNCQTKLGTYKKILIIVTKKNLQTAHVYLQVLDTRLIYKYILYILVMNILDKKNFCFSPYFKYKQAEPLRSWVICPKLHSYLAELGIKRRNSWPWV